MMTVEPVVENKVKNRLTIPSRNTRVEITNELLAELEQLGITFEVN